MENHKLHGIDIFICINNEKFPDELTINKPYRVFKMCRKDYDIYYFIKNELRERRWYKSELFREKR